LLYLMFRFDGDVMENLDFGEVFGASKHTPRNFQRPKKNRCSPDP